MLQGKQIICLSAVDWEGAFWARPQQLMSLLGRDNAVLYVEPPITLLSPLKNPSLWKKWGQWRRGPRAVADNIHVYSPPVLLPFGSRYRLINRLNQWRLGRSLRRVAAGLKFGKPILWTYLPNTVDMLGALRESLVCYDCVDEHAAFSGFSPAVVTAMERELFRRSDIAFASARNLYQAKKGLAASLHLIPNAADAVHFARALEPGPRPADLPPGPGPVIGFVGGVHDWVDLDLVKYAAEKKPEWNFVLIGPVQTETEPLKRLPNVRFLGGRPYRDLPDYLRHFTACLIPFKLNDLTVNVNPVKLYEYLAAGKPVVATPLPELTSYAAVVYTAADPAGFLAALEQAVREDNPARREERIAVARANSWAARCRRMAELIGEKLREK